MSAARPVAIASRDEGEELQRAELYGLLARLWFAPPDEALREQFAVAVTDAPERGSFLEPAWQALVAAMRSSSAADAAEAFDTLFVGVGKPDIFPYGSHFIAGMLNERPLVALRADLVELGLTRDPGDVTEDHVAFVLEVMRYLIAGDEVEICNLERQRRFFRAHVQPWIGRLCEAVEQHPRAGPYAALAAFTRAFIEVETQAFDMVE